MPRVKRGVHAKKRKRKVMKAAKGYRGGNSRLLRTAREMVDRAGQFAYRDRKVKKREMRRLWITRINAAARENDITYSRLIDGLAKANVEVDRKMLADMAVNDPAAFSKMVDVARQNLAA